MPSIALIVAIAQDGAIGKENHLLCHLPLDLKHFKEITLDKTIVMGRRTFESLPQGALPRRKNIVLSANKGLSYDGVTLCHSLQEALTMHANGEEPLFVIGGASLYKEALPLADELYITWIEHTFEGADTFFPAFDLQDWILLSREQHVVDEKNIYPFVFSHYQRKQ